MKQEEGTYVNSQADNEIYYNDIQRKQYSAW